MRPTCSVFIAISADGFIARPDGAIDWLAAVERKGEDYGYQKFFDTVDVLVTGRNTYDVVAGFEAWPYAGKRVVVLTHRPVVPRHGEAFFAGTPAALLGTLEGARRVYIDGGDVIRQFLAAGLIDDLTLSVIPVLLGSGIPLFTSGGIGSERTLALEDSTRFESGLVQLKYRVGQTGG